MRREPDAEPRSTESEELPNPWLVAEVFLLLTTIVLALAMLTQSEEPCFFAADYPACLDRP